MPDVLIQGQAGRLEGKYSPAGAPDAPIALILHPHPLHGGTMNNKICYSLYHSYVRQGFATLRFNYRGVGKSQGSWGEVEGELADASAALQWLQMYNPNASEIWVAGFSFGAYLAMQLLMRRPEIDSFMCVAPPANIFDFNFLAPCPSSGLIVQGEKDQVVPQASVDKLVQKLNLQKDISIDYRIVPGAGHFFNDQLTELEGHVDDYLNKWYQPEAIALAS